MLWLVQLIQPIILFSVGTLWPNWIESQNASHNSPVHCQSSFGLKSRGEEPVDQPSDDVVPRLSLAVHGVGGQDFLDETLFLKNLRDLI